jgi:hypothetical protein
MAHGSFSSKAATISFLSHHQQLTTSSSIFINSGKDLLSFPSSTTHDFLFNLNQQRQRSPFFPIINSSRLSLH